MATCDDASAVTSVPNAEPSMQVLETVSEALDTTVTDLPPLYEAVDPDCLDQIFHSHTDSGWITFEYVDHFVTVQADGTVEVDRMT